MCRCELHYVLRNVTAREEQEHRTIIQIYIDTTLGLENGERVDISLWKVLLETEGVEAEPSLHIYNVLGVV